MKFFPSHFGPLCRFLPVVCLATALGCSAWIDDFEVDDTSSDVDTDGDGDTDGDADTDGDGDTSGGWDCGQDVTTPAGDTLEFCGVKGGSSYLGCTAGKMGEASCFDDETPAHLVTLSDYIIGRYEVSGEQFAGFIADQPDWSSDGVLAAEKCNSSYLQGWIDGNPPSSLARTPASSLCWYAARAFCQWLGDGFDLPTEAQWEFAARGRYDGHEGNPYRSYPFGNQPQCNLGNFENCAQKPLVIGSTDGISPYGLYDLGGNAWEWVRDWYQDAYYCDPEQMGIYKQPDCDMGFSWTNPAGPASGTSKVLRGGSWYHPANMMRTAKRHGTSPNNSSNLSGFRCVR